MLQVRFKLELVLKVYRKLRLIKAIKSTRAIGSSRFVTPYLSACGDTPLETIYNNPQISMGLGHF